MRGARAGIEVRIAFMVMLLPALLFFSQCAKKKPVEETPLAEVYGERLYEKDIPRSIYLLEDQEVRRIKIQNYARQWVREKVMLKEALKKVEGELYEIDRMADEYKKALIIYRYQEWLVDMMLDTNVSESDLIAFYEDNQEEFSLKKNIVRLDFAKLPVDVPDVKDAALRMKRYGFEDSLHLREYFRMYALNHYFDDGNWLNLSDVVKEVPLKFYDEEVFLRSNKFLKLEDGNYIFLVYIRDYRVRNSVSPFERERNSIRNMILNQRKRKLLDKLEQKMLESARLKGDVIEY